jgi:hypothetical protein
MLSASGWPVTIGFAETRPTPRRFFRPWKEYDQLIAAANEDARDVETLRRSISRVESGEEETFTSAEVDAFLAAKTPLAFFAILEWGERI